MQSKRPFFDSDFQDLNPVIFDYLGEEENKKLLNSFRKNSGDDEIKPFVSKLAKQVLYKSVLTDYVVCCTYLERKVDSVSVKELNNYQEYKTFCEKHYKIFYDALDRMLEERKEEKQSVVRNCIVYCCVTVHPNAWRLYNKALSKGNYEFANEFLKQYPNVDQLYKTAQLEYHDLLAEIISRELPQNIQNRLAWVEIVQQLVKVAPDTSVLEHKISAPLTVDEVGVGIFCFLSGCFVLAFCCWMTGGCAESPINNQNKFLYAWGFEEKNKITRQFSYSKEVQEAALDDIKQYIKDADLETIFGIYALHVNATYLDQRTHRISMFNSNLHYSKAKIKFIEAIQERALKIPSSFEIAFSERRAIYQDLINHPIFSIEHEKSGVGANINYRKILASNLDYERLELC
jgi:hypothetical protein